jgi:hypothetical protein
MKDMLDAQAVPTGNVSRRAISEQSQLALRSANKSLNQIRRITAQMQMLAINAKIEAAKAGQFGRGFAVVAGEVGSVGSEISAVAENIQSDLSKHLHLLDTMIASMESNATGQRLIDLAYTAVDTIDRNLYERTCDVRWWATDHSFVNALTTKDPADIAHAASRLGVILASYGIYLDLWICDLDGRIIANARPEAFQITDASVCDFPWFAQAMAQTSGQEFAVGEIVQSRLLNHKQSLSYACAIREDGNENGRILGVLATCFDWEAQARSIVGNMRMDDEGRRAETRILLVDRHDRVIAASDGKGFLSERAEIPAGLSSEAGWYTQNGKIVGFHRTNGFETYQGLGWRGMVIQSLG